MRMKICSQCGEEKDYTHYNKEPRNSDGYTGSCKECRNSNRRGKRQLEGKKHRAKQYGLSVEQYEAYFLEASCGICGIKDDLVLDHNHETGEVRGVLCGKCNRGLGLFNDNIEDLKGAIEWLEEKGSYGFKQI